jgi:hypothetical protein
MDVLKKTEGDLTKGKDKLDKMIKDLEQEKVSVLSVKPCALYCYPKINQPLLNKHC